MSIILVTGATGTLGTPTVRRLRSAGHEVRALSRRSGDGLTTGDLLTGAGIPEAFAGAGTVIHLATGLRDVDQGRAAIEAAVCAGVGHFVLISIVGIDRVGGPYYKLKLAQERAVREGGVPWTILRATQFHTLVAQFFTKSAKLGVVPSVSAPLQPVDPGEVGRALADTAESEPSLAITQFAGPEVLSVRELARRWRAATGSHAVPVRLPATRSLRSGGLINPGAWRGEVTFDAWLA
jgi:uncharacterized protein YbjT (DUF2867 family)